MRCWDAPSVSSTPPPATSRQASPPTRAAVVQGERSAWGHRCVRGMRVSMLSLLCVQRSVGHAGVLLHVGGRTPGIHPPCRTRMRMVSALHDA